MPSFPYETVDVFTDRSFGGNPLAVFTDARGLSDAQMQALAAEMNYSETTFVLPPDDPANDARVRIFHRTAEMPFAGHPNVGTACVLEGSVTQGLAVMPSGNPQTISVEHPTGEFSVELGIDPANPQNVTRAALLRTARLLMRGEVMVPRSVWTRPATI